MDLLTQKVPLNERHLRSLLEQRSSDGIQPYAISLSGHGPRSATSFLLLSAMAKALVRDSKLPDPVRQVRGMSGQMYRSLINNLLELHEDPRYLEIGSFEGSTATAALYGNSARCVCIDNWSQFGGPKAQFEENMKLVLSDKTDFTFMESDFRAVDFSAIGRFNIYMFDGPHAEADQYDGVRLAQPALDDSYVLVVDDWNWEQVRAGTFRALVEAGSAIEMAIEVRTTADNSHPTVAFTDSDWHNGYFIGVIQKRGSGRLASA